MNLADYQKEIVNQIYQLLVEDENKAITLHGDVGCGKSTIAQGIVELLQEDWTVFWLEGIDQCLAPYLTWHIGTKIYSKKNLELGAEIAFGVNFLPSPVSLEFGVMAQYSKQNLILTPSEEALVEEIRKRASGNHNILFVADNYELWDIPSRQLLEKLMFLPLNLLTDFHLVTLFISREKFSTNKMVSVIDIPIGKISDDDIIYVLRQHDFSNHININDIRVCAGNDLTLALMAASYDNQEVSPILNFNGIMEKRCNNLSSEGKEVCKVLGSLSIIDSYFSKDETAFFIDPMPSDADETEYLAEEYLALAKDQMFITGENNYHFVNERVKAYFKARLSREKYYHRKFADYLQKRHPGDYFNRGKHLQNSIQFNDSKIILEAWQLLLLSFLRRSSEIGRMDDIYNILEEINLLLCQLPKGLEELQRYTLKEFLVGYQEFSKYNYQEAKLHLQSITPSRLIPASLAECQRLTLLCHIQLAENRAIINQLSEELYENINSPDFQEDEQYCRAVLVLLDTYIDRLNDGEKVKVLKRRFIQIVQQHIDDTKFEEFEACYNRKAALYYSALIASRQTTQSINFYKNHFNRNELYMAYCNHLGNTIIIGDYEDAKKCLGDIDKLFEQNDEWYYPCRYKIENNRILLEFLVNENKLIDNRDEYLDLVQTTAMAFSKILLNQKNEVSHVVLFNYLGLSILCGSKFVEKELEEAKENLSDIDGYYQYFLHDLLFANALLNGNIEVAEQELNILQELDVPLLREYQKIFRKRQLKQKKLLEKSQNIKVDPLNYHISILTACAHIQDPSCHFYGRGFLLSDLQFLSF